MTHDALVSCMWLLKKKKESVWNLEYAVACEWLLCT